MEICTVRFLSSFSFRPCPRVYGYFWKYIWKYFPCILASRMYQETPSFACIHADGWNGAKTELIENTNIMTKWPCPHVYRYFWEQSIFHEALPAACHQVSSCGNIRVHAVVASATCYIVPWLTFSLLVLGHYLNVNQALGQSRRPTHRASQRGCQDLRRVWRRICASHNTWETYMSRWRPLNPVCPVCLKYGGGGGGVGANC